MIEDIECLTCKKRLLNSHGNTGKVKETLNRSAEEITATFEELYLESSRILDKREKAIQERKLEKEKQEMKECTFRPNTGSKITKFSNSFLQRQEQWAKAKIDHVQKLKTNKTENDGFKECSFKPKLIASNPSSYLKSRVNSCLYDKGTYQSKYKLKIEYINRTSANNAKYHIPSASYTKRTNPEDYESQNLTMYPSIENLSVESSNFLIEDTKICSQETE